MTTPDPNVSLAAAAARGVCTNLPDACALAASRQPQPLDAQGGRCSGCGAALMVPSPTSASVGDHPTATPVRRWLPWLLALALLVGGLLAWWWSGRAATPPAAAQAAPSVATPASGTPRIRLHGSNTVGATLAPALARAFLASEGHDDIQEQPGAVAEERLLVGRRPSDNARIEVELHAHGTGTAFTSLAQGKADIGMASRAVKAEELHATQALGDLSAEGSEYVIALDGVAVIVHPSNPLQRLTLAQIRDLFSGRVADWSALGAPAGAVRLHARDDKSGTWDTFRSLVLDKVALAPGATRYEDSRALSDAVSADPLAIGFIGLPYIRTAKTLAVADGAAEALRPSRFTVATEDYALARRLHFYVARDADPLARRLADFAVTEAGQQIAQSAGFVGQFPEADERSGGAAATGDLPAEYRRLTGSARRLAVNLRFRPGVDRLDNKALRDVTRITRRMEARDGRPRQLMLLGFSDNQGDRCANLTLSVQRAQAVGRELGTYGIRPAVVQGYGLAAPVASNDTAAGRERNRRVEVWLLDGPVPAVAPATCASDRATRGAAKGEAASAAPLSAR
jgi:phosphate transport system substrate-binding protein